MCSGELDALHVVPGDVVPVCNVGGHDALGGASLRQAAEVKGRPSRGQA